MDELDALGGALSAFGGGGGGLGGGGDQSTTTATSGAPITANTDINFGSGDIADSPTVTNTPSTVAQPGLTAQPASATVPTPQQYATPYNGLPGTISASTASNKLPLYIGGLVLAALAVYVISQHKG
jgi:hypothetical protein